MCYSPWGHNKSDMTEQLNNKYTTTTESRPGHNITEGHKVGKRLEGGKDSQAAGETQAPVGAEGQAGAVGRRAGRQLRGRLWRRTQRGSEAAPCGLRARGVRPGPSGRRGGQQRGGVEVRCRQQVLGAGRTCETWMADFLCGVNWTEAPVPRQLATLILGVSGRVFLEEICA